jgi:predicted DNA-binding ribbon-helix-helix protein
VNRNVVAAGNRTSMRLEPEFWDAARHVCLREGIDLPALVDRACEASNGAGGRTSALRTYLLNYFRAGSRLPHAAEPDR